MIRILTIFIAIFLLLPSLPIATGAAQADRPIDLADVPLPTQDLPEEGYQVLTGAYLSLQETASSIANARALDEFETLENLSRIGLERAYVLDLVLSENRGRVDSPALAIIETTVYALDDGSQAETLLDLLTNYSALANVEPQESLVPFAITVLINGSAGRQMRSIIVDDDVIIEVVSLDATGTPDEIEHALILEGTQDRLHTLRKSSSTGASLMALRLEDDASVANFAHAQQTGVHGIYRYRDGVVQPAIGELTTPYWRTSTELESLYLTNQIMAIGGGYGSISVWLGEFSTEEHATAFFDALLEGNPTDSLADPYFLATTGETWQSQGIRGVFRVSGEMNGEAYSGNIEIRQQGNTVVAVGYRVIGAVTSSDQVNASLMDQQLSCLREAQVCPPILIANITPLPQATPIIDTEINGSAQFAWMLSPLEDDWRITERFAEPGYDRMEIRGGTSIFTLESIVNHHGDPMQCIMDELSQLQEFEEHSYITVWEDTEGNTEGGNERDHAWIVYNIEPLTEERADQEYVMRIDCYRLMSREANLVMTQLTPIDFWDDERDRGDHLREHLHFPLNGIPLPNGTARTLISAA